MEDLIKMQRAQIEALQQKIEKQQKLINSAKEVFLKMINDIENEKVD